MHSAPTISATEAAERSTRVRFDAPGERPPSSATGGGQDLPNLDLLRAVAVLAVLEGHIQGALSHDHYPGFFGGFGVALFFLHTSLVLMWSLERRPRVVDFYVRRIFRIYPLAIVAVVIAVALRVPASPMTENGPFFVYAHATHKQVVATLALAQNIFSGNLILYPMWSLPLEVQMYLLLPLFYFFLRLFPWRWPLLALWLASVALLWRYGANEKSLLLAVPFFACGLIAFVGFRKVQPRYRASFFTLTLAACFVWGGSSGLGGWVRAAWAPLVLGLALPYFHQLRAAWITRPAWYVARYSYGMYLAHPFAIWIALDLLHAYAMSVRLSVLALLVVVLPVAAYHSIEAPCMKLGARLAKRIA